MTLAPRWIGWALATIALLVGGGGSAAAAPAPPAAADDPAFGIAWHQHPVHESGVILDWERATLTNTGTVDLDLVSVGFDSVPYAHPNPCALAPGQSCEVTVGDLIIGGDYPATWTRDLVATMRTPSGQQVTRTQVITLTMVDDLPLPPYALLTPDGIGAQTLPHYCLGWYSERFQVVEPRTLRALTSATYGDLLDPANPAVAPAQPWAPCHRDYAWTATERPAWAFTDVIRMTFVDDDGNQVTREESVTWPGADPPPLVITASLAPSVAIVDETGGVPHFTVTVRNDAPIAVRELAITTADGRDLLLESATGGGNGRCDGPAAVVPRATRTCTYAPRSPLSGAPGSTVAERISVRATPDAGEPITATAQAAVSFRDVLPDVRLAAAAAPVRPPSGAVRLTVTGLSPEAAIVERIDVLGLATVLGTTCGPGQRVARGATWSCEVEVRARGWRRWLPIGLRVRVRDDEGNALVRTAYAFPFPWGELGPVSGGT